jgi:hypothetical protein
MKCVCNADKVAVGDFNGWFHDHYVSQDDDINKLRRRLREYEAM